MKDTVPCLDLIFSLQDETSDLTRAMALMEPSLLGAFSKAKRMDMLAPAIDDTLGLIAVMAATGAELALMSNPLECAAADCLSHMPNALEAVASIRRSALLQPLWPDRRVSAQNRPLWTYMVPQSLYRLFSSVVPCSQLILSQLSTREWPPLPSPRLTDADQELLARLDPAHSRHLTPDAFIAHVEGTWTGAADPDSRKLRNLYRSWVVVRTAAHLYARRVAPEEWPDEIEEPGPTAGKVPSINETACLLTLHYCTHDPPRTAAGRVYLFAAAAMGALFANWSAAAIANVPADLTGSWELVPRWCPTAVRRDYPAVVIASVFYNSIIWCRQPNARSLNIAQASKLPDDDDDEEEPAVMHMKRSATAALYRQWVTPTVHSSAATTAPRGAVQTPPPAAADVSSSRVRPSSPEPTRPSPAVESDEDDMLSSGEEINSMATSPQERYQTDGNEPADEDVVSARKRKAAPAGRKRSMQRRKGGPPESEAEEDEDGEEEDEEHAVARPKGRPQRKAASTSSSRPRSFSRTSLQQKETANLTPSKS